MKVELCSCSLFFQFALRSSRITVLLLPFSSGELVFLKKCSVERGEAIDMGRVVTAPSSQDRLAGVRGQRTINKHEMKPGGGASRVAEMRKKYAMESRAKARGRVGVSAAAIPLIKDELSEPPESTAQKSKAGELSKPESSSQKSTDCLPQSQEEDASFVEDTAALRSILTNRGIADEDRPVTITNGVSLPAFRHQTLRSTAVNSAAAQATRLDELFNKRTSLRGPNRKSFVLKPCEKPFSRKVAFANTGAQPDSVSDATENRRDSWLFRASRKDCRKSFCLPSVKKLPPSSLKRSARPLNILGGPPAEIDQPNFNEEVTVAAMLKSNTIDQDTAGTSNSAQPTAIGDLDEETDSVGNLPQLNVRPRTNKPRRTADFVEIFGSLSPGSLEEIRLRKQKELKALNSLLALPPPQAPPRIAAQQTVERSVEEELVPSSDVDRLSIIPEGPDEDVVSVRRSTRLLKSKKPSVATTPTHHVDTHVDVINEQDEESTIFFVPPEYEADTTLKAVVSPMPAAVLATPRPRLPAHRRRLQEESTPLQDENDVNTVADCQPPMRTPMVLRSTRKRTDQLSLNACDSTPIREGGDDDSKDATLVDSTATDGSRLAELKKRGCLKAVVDISPISFAGSPKPSRQLQSPVVGSPLTKSCDIEVQGLLSKSASTVSARALRSRNPVAIVLTEGDESCFLPIAKPVNSTKQSTTSGTNAHSNRTASKPKNR